LRPRLQLTLLLAAVLALWAGASLAHAAGARFRVGDEISSYRSETWRWQRLMGVPRSPSNYRTMATGERYRHWVRDLWKRRARRVRHLAARPPHSENWRCIHSHEAGWTAHTGNGYYGGLQMDFGFQQHYGRFLLRRKGTADNWTPVEQMWVAERSQRAGRGFWPWPNAARICGLL
jgi:hypothetical protein